MPDHRSPRLRATVAILALGVLGCTEDRPPESVGPDPAEPSFARADRGRENLGRPLEDMTGSELAMFSAGAVTFEKNFTDAEGHGPLHNGSSDCAFCHGAPTTGGNGRVFGGGRVVTGTANHATHWDNGVCTHIPGGPVMQSDFEVDDPDLEIISELEALRLMIENEGYPAEIARRTAPDLFGFGLLEAVPDQTIIDLAAEQAAMGRVSGRVTLVHGHVGKFGRKGNVPDLHEFTAEAYINEQGLTSAEFPNDNWFLGDPGHVLSDDGVTDPEVSAQDIEEVTAFQRFLAPPEPHPGAGWGQGKQIFEDIGCADCHVPSLRTDKNHPSEALRNRRVDAYTDLLVHDVVGSATNPNDGNGSDICIPLNIVVHPDEFRTEPLMGLRFKQEFMHDGAQRTIEDAILRHAGEATASVSGFTALSAGDRGRLLEFLNSL